MNLLTSRHLRRNATFRRISGPLSARQDKENSAAHIDSALEALEEAGVHGDALLNWLLVEPAFDQLKEKDRFWELVERTGISLAPGQKKDVSPTGDPGQVPDTDIFNRETLLAPVNDDPVTAEAGTKKPAFWRKVSFAAGAAVICLSIAAVLIYQFVPFHFSAAFTSIKPEFAYQRPSLMVAPFKASGNTGVGIGFADALGQRLGVVNGIEVISSNTARIISSGDPLEGASKIGVKFLMTGELSERDGKLYLDAVLIDVPTKRNVLKTQFAAEGSDYFDLQKQAGQKILETIGITPQPLELKQIEKAYTNDLFADEKYLIGRSQLAMRNASGLRNEITSFSEAVEAVGEFARAYVGLADAYSLLNLYDIEPPADAYSIAKRNAERALKLDDDLAEAHASLAYIRFFAERDREGAEPEFRRAIKMIPSIICPDTPLVCSCPGEQ